MTTLPARDFRETGAEESYTEGVVDRLRAFSLRPGDADAAVEVTEERPRGSVRLR